MARSIVQIQNQLIASLVTYAASIGITINPNEWIYVPGQISETDYKLLLLNTVASGIGFEEQLEDLFKAHQEKLIASASPQTGLWYQNQMINVFQWNDTTPQLPKIILPNVTPVFDPVVDDYKVIKFCSAEFASAGRCLIHVAAENADGLPADLDSTVGSGALVSAQAFVNETSAPGISYVVLSGKSDWLFLQIDLYYKGSFSGSIFNDVQSAITSFLNNLSTTAFNNNSLASFKLSSLENAILSVNGVDDMVFINVAARPDENFTSPGSTTFGTSQQVFLVSSSTESQRLYQTYAGYISLENGTSTGGSVPNSQLGDYRVGSSGILNLNLIPVG